MTESKPMRLKNQFAYAVNEIASNPIYTITLSFLTFFYTDTLGVDAALVGAVILVSKLFDGISDIWAGNLIDHTHTRRGSARPWILRSAVPLALSYILLFTVPQVGNLGKIIYIFVSYNFAMTFAFTIFNAAINALPIYITDDSKSRASAYSIRMIFAGLVQAVLSFLCLDVVKALGGGQMAWIKVSAVLALISLAASLITYFGTKETVIPPEQQKEDIPLKDALKGLMKNKYWFLVLGMIIMIVFHQVVTLTVGVYYAKYVLFDETLAGSLTLYHHGGGAVGMLAMPFILQKGVSKKKAAVFGTILMICGTVLAIMRSDGMFLILSLALRGAGFGIVNSLYYGMLADTVDYGEWKSGLRTQGVTTSAGSLGMKLGSGISTALIGFVLSLSGYDGLAASQTSAAVNTIRILFIIVPLFLYLTQALILHFYKLDDELPKIREELSRRRGIIAGEE